MKKVMYILFKRLHIYSFNKTKTRHFKRYKLFLHSLSFKDWQIISRYQTSLSENFIREFKDRVDWVKISQYQTLSEDFILEFKEDSSGRGICVNWRRILENQKLSMWFLISLEYEKFKILIIELGKKPFEALG